MPRPVRVEQLPGTPFGVAYLPVAPAVSGLTVGSLVAGIGALMVGILTICSGVAGRGGTGLLMAGAFAILALLLCAAAVVSGVLGLRQVRRSAGERTGRGLAIAGWVCGAVGALFTVSGLVLPAVLGS